jgi:Cache 3/Cache 2 fusion domain
MDSVFPHLIAAPAAVRPFAKKTLVVGMLVLSVCIAATPILVPSVGCAQDARVAKSMAALKEQTAKLGAPKIVGTNTVGGRDAPALYFGSTKMNNNFSVVDAVAEEGGRGMAATLFVRSGDDYIRVATNVSMRIGSGRGVGTVLSGPALKSIRAGNAYYGKGPVLGTPYISGYEPIKDASGAIIGIYFVGYKK